MNEITAKRKAKDLLDLLLSDKKPSLMYIILSSICLTTGSNYYVMSSQKIHLENIIWRTISHAVFWQEAFKC